MLNSGLSGLGYMSHDVGGFAIDESRPYDPELYMRWLQLGTFSPVLRTHAQQTAEPYHYPDIEPTLQRYIKERYRWLPYNYTLAWENATTGAPLVRPVNFYTGTAKGDDINDEYLWGRNLLVAPVLTEGARSRRVILPDDGSKWFNLYDIAAAPVAGGDTITVDAPLDVLPLFARGGSFIPVADYEMDNTADFNTRQYTVNFYPVDGVGDTFNLFEDDHLSTRSLADGAFAIVRFDGSRDLDGATTINVTSEGNFAGREAVKQLTFKVFNTSARPAAVYRGGKKMPRRDYTYDPATRCLTIKTAWDTATPLNIKFN